MSLNGDTHLAAVSRPGVLKRFWRAFNRWRKRYFWIRLLFLLLFGAYVCRTAFFPVLPGLVRMAIDAIEARWDPSLINAMARHNRVSLAHRLQLSLRRGLDMDGDGSLAPSELKRLRDLQLEPEELQKKSVDVSLPQLIEASHRAGLLPTSYTVSTARREAWFAAVGEVEAMKRPVRARIEAMLKWWEVPDYSRLETWKRGAVLLLQWLQRPVYALGRPRTVLAWLTFCFSVALMASAFLRRGKFAKSLLLGGALAVPLILRWFLFDFSLYWIKYDFSIICQPITFLCLSMACAGCAGRIAAGRRRPRFYFSSAALGLGIVLLVWALPRWLSGEAFRPLPQETYTLLWWGSLIDDTLLWLAIPAWLKDGAVVLGAISAIGGGLALGRFPKFAWRKWPAVSSEPPEQQEKPQE